MTADREPQLSITFDAVRDKTVEQLKIMNTVIFPIRYPEKIYQDCLACGELSQFAYHNDVAIGSVACRTEKLPSGGARLYILTLGVLAPYRGMGVGTRLLQQVLSLAAEDDNIKEAALHVQVCVCGWWGGCMQGFYYAGKCTGLCSSHCSHHTISTPLPHKQVGNEDVLRFYKRAGFEVKETVAGFYKRLTPPDALLLTKALH